jgi:5-carboxymethyl-2-hydroxymuconate isomerase
MPHVVVLYTSQLERETDIGALCRSLADTMKGCVDEAGKPVFPVGGIRVLAYPTAHHAVGDGSADMGFVYLHLRMARGRSAATQQKAGEALTATTKAHFAPLLERRLCGITLQIDEGPEVFDAKIGNLHAYYAGRAKA